MATLRAKRLGGTRRLKPHRRKLINCCRILDLIARAIGAASAIPTASGWSVVVEHAQDGRDAKMSASDVTRAVACALKPPVFLHFGGSKMQVSCSGVCVIDASLPPGKTVNIETITFKNFYTALVSVRLRRRSPGRKGEGGRWCTALRDCPLMTNPHAESGAQDYCSIDRKQMRMEPDDVSSVRLVLKQPSCAWLTFGVEDVRLFPRAQPEPVGELSDWLSALNLVERRLPTQGSLDAASVSCRLQPMWALSQVTTRSSRSHTAPVERFDVDGSYDINLLSLT
ncbi:nicolin-1 isoform X2 [Syngnathus typhle]|uniref:nicolin-1 isoform X2 n=1 Tax=Syngnathus typhle TaxID=161592 RepID=UPI002A6B20AA|nr:nicolin-1 isoform X2 [Syngnathus typhle]